MFHEPSSARRAARPLIGAGPWELGVFLFGGVWLGEGADGMDAMTGVNLA